MVLHGPLADAEIGGNVLAGVPREHEIEYLALARGETGETRRCRVAPRGQLGRIAHLLQRVIDTGEQLLVADRLLEEIHRPCVHRPHRHVHVAIAGDHDRRQPAALVLQALQQREPAHPRHHGIDQQASLGPGAIIIQECLRAGIGLYRPAIPPKQIVHRSAYVAVIVDHENDRALPAIARRRRSSRLRCRRRLALREKIPDAGRQLRERHRLVELGAAVTRDLS